MTDTVCVPERPVSTPARVFVAATAALAAWQIGWLADQAEDLAGRLPPPWSVGWWIAAWTVTLVTALTGAITGRDRHVRVALAVLFVVEVMGITTAIGDHLPMGSQFWTVGQAAWIAVGCAGMLASSLRPAPDPSPVLDAIDDHRGG